MWAADERMALLSHNDDEESASTRVSRARNSLMLMLWQRLVGPCFVEELRAEDEQAAVDEY